MRREDRHKRRMFLLLCLVLGFDIGLIHPAPDL